MQYNVIQCNAIKCNDIQDNSKKCKSNVMKGDTIKLNSIKYFKEISARFYFITYNENGHQEHEKLCNTMDEKLKDFVLKMGLLQGR